MKFSIGFITLFVIVGFAATVFAGDGKRPIATGDAYFDKATGHRYIKNSETTYAEFSKKGKLLRESLPNDQPHLAISKYIKEIQQDSYLIYERNSNQQKESIALPSHEKHPQGWSCTKLLLSAI